jgi:hypothetical protein
MEKSGKKPKLPHLSTTLPTPSTSTPTPDSNDGEDTSMSISVEEVMDMDPDSGSDVENDEMVDREGAAGKSSDMLPPTLSPWTAHDANTMDLDESSFHSRLTTVPSDPRRRAPPDS